MKVRGSGPERIGDGRRQIAHEPESPVPNMFNPLTMSTLRTRTRLREEGCTVQDHVEGECYRCGRFELHDMHSWVTLMTCFAVTQKLNHVQHEVTLVVGDQVKRGCIRASGTNRVAILEINHQTVAPDEVHPNQHGYVVKICSMCSLGVR